MHHGHFSKHILELVYTEYEVHRSIIRHGRPIQLIPPQNLVFGTLTPGYLVRDWRYNMRFSHKCCF